MVILCKGAFDLKLAKTDLVFGRDIRCGIRHYKSIKRGQDWFLSAFVLPYAKGVHASRDSPMEHAAGRKWKKEKINKTKKIILEFSQ